MTTNNGTTTALVRAEPTSNAIEPRNMAELEVFAEAAAKSGFFGAKNKEQALMIAMAGRDLGLSYTQALRMFHVIDPGPDKKTGELRPAKLVISADGMVAVCLSKPHVCEYFRIIESTSTFAVVEAKRVGDPARQARFSIEDARAAGLVKDWGNWKSYPARMCLARAKAFLARDLFPDLLAGLYDPDEIRDTFGEPRPIEVHAVAKLAAKAAEAYDMVQQPDLAAIQAASLQQSTSDEVVTNEMLTKVAEAVSQEDLDAVAKLAVKAVREDLITEAQFTVIGQHVKSRRKELAK